MSTSEELRGFGSNTGRYITQQQKKRETQDKEQAEEELKKKIFAKIDNEITNAKIEIASEVVKPMEKDIREMKNSMIKRDEINKLFDKFLNDFSHAIESIEDPKVKGIIQRTAEAFRRG